MKPFLIYLSRRCILGAATAWIIVSPAYCALAQKTNLEEQQKSWFLSGSDLRYRLELHQTTSHESHAGRAGEHLRLSASTGTYVYARHRITEARIINELQVGLWLKADRPGMQIRARVVLPRSVDPQTGKPLIAIVSGSSYQLVGSWERLSLENFPLLLQRQIRILRRQFGGNVDGREAYIDQILLNAYGGVGTTNLWIGEIDIQGAVPVTLPHKNIPIPLATFQQISQNISPQSRPPQRKIPSRARLESSNIVLDGIPFFPRAIEYQGEPLVFLKQLGFNTIQLSSPPSQTLLEEARQSGLWIVCPPPEVNNGQKIGSLYDHVLAWDLGHHLSSHQLSATRRLAERIRSADDRSDRPLICHADTNLKAYSRLTSLLLLDRQPLGTTFELSDYFSWLQQRPHFARPVTLFWSTIQTEPHEQWLAQLKTFGDSSHTPAIVESQQIRLLTYSAISAGVRGLCFQSSSRLDKNDPATRHRAESLELINLELSVIQTWIVKRSSLREADPKARDMNAVVLGLQRSHLLLVTNISPGSQYTVNPPSQKNVTIVIPGIPESSKAYQLTPLGIHQLRTQRGTGGTFINLSNTDFASFVVLTEDPLAIYQLDKQLRKQQARTIMLHHHLAARELEMARNIYRKIAGYSQQVPQASQLLQQAESSLLRSSQGLGTNDLQQVLQSSQESFSQIAKLRRISWESAVQQFKSPISSPYCARFDSLPIHWRLAQRLRQSRPGENRLNGGDFENLQNMQQYGWNHQRHEQPEIESYVELSPETPYTGRYALRMRAVLSDPQAPTRALESPPVWVTSAPVPLEPGTFVRIHGWVRVDQAITGSADGLLIVDSFGGLPLAERIHQTNLWQEFTLYRVATTKSQPLTITFALTGIGDVFLDDLTVTPLEIASSTRPAAALSQAQRLRSIFSLPR